MVSYFRKKYILQKMMLKNEKANLTTNSCRFFIVFYGTKKIELIRKISDNFRRILLVDVKIEAVNFVLINIYKANTKPAKN